VQLPTSCAPKDRQIEGFRAGTFRDRICPMQAVFIALIAVLGTLGGAGITGALQQKNAVRLADDAQSERRRQERLTAYLEFGQAIAQLRNAEITRWTARSEFGRESSEYGAAKAEEYRTRSAARSALIRIQLLIDSDDLLQGAHQVLDVTITLEQASSEDNLAELAARSRDVTDAFIRSAARRGGLAT
jgi:hypothetical protein